MRNNGILGVARWYSFRIIFSKIKLLQINNNIPYLLAVQKNYFLPILRKPLENYAI